MESNIYSILIDMIAKSKRCKNLHDTVSLVKCTVRELQEKQISWKVEDIVLDIGKEKSRFCMEDKYGVQYTVSVYDLMGKLFFVVCANGKTVECMEIDTKQ